LLIFLRTNVIFCTKNNLDIVRWVQIPHRAASFEEFFPRAVVSVLPKSAHAGADVRGGAPVHDSYSGGGLLSHPPRARGEVTSASP